MAVTATAALTFATAFIPALSSFIIEVLKHREAKRDRKSREARELKELCYAKKHAQQDIERGVVMKKLQEELDRERRDRIEAEKMRGREADQLRQLTQLCIKMVSQMMLQQQQHQQKTETAYSCHAYQNQSKCHCKKTYVYEPKHQSYKVELPEEFDDDEEHLLSIFSTSFLQIKDDLAHSFDAPMHRKDIGLFELPDQHPEGFEDNILSLVLAKLSGADHEVAKEEGNAYFKEQKFDQAIKCYTKSIDISPTAKAYANRAEAYLKLNKFVQAEEDCTEALDIDGNYFKAYARRAIARAKLGHNHKGALEDVKIALKSEPNCQEMKNLHTELECTLSKGSSVERANDRNAKHCVEDATQAKDKGNVYYKQQKFEEAIKCYTKSIDISPTAKAYANRAEAYMKLNKYAEVEEDCTKALKLDDKYFKVYARRAIARKILRRNLEGALEDTESALLLEPTDLEMKKLRAEVMNLI